MKKIILLALCAKLFLAHTLLANVEMLVTSGSLASQNPYESFYESRLFQNEIYPPFIISHANAKVLESDSSYFYADGGLSFQEILELKKYDSIRAVNTILGNSYRAFTLSGIVPKDIVNFLGADLKSYYQAIYQTNNKIIYVINKHHLNNKVTLPKHKEELKEVPAVLLSDNNNQFTALAIARVVNGDEERFGLIDHLKRQYKQALLVDLGNEKADHKSISENNIKVFGQKSSSLMLLGTKEMSWLKNIPALEEGVYPIKGKHMLNIDKVNFWSLRDNEKKWQFFSDAHDAYTFSDLVSDLKQKNNENKFNIVRVFSQSAAQKVAALPEVDAVLLISFDAKAQMPSKEEINLENAKVDIYEQVAPILSFSPLDVSVVEIIGSPQKVKSIIIKRHPIGDDAPRSQEDVVNIKFNSEIVLSSKSQIFPGSHGWDRDDFNNIYGGMAIAHDKADIAIFEETGVVTPLYGDIPSLLLQKILFHGDKITVSLPGNFLKKVIKLLPQAKKKFIVYGMDTRKQTIGDRKIQDKALYVLSLTKEAFYEIDKIAKKGGFTSVILVRAPFIEAISSDTNQLFYISGPKSMSSAYTPTSLTKANEELSLNRISLDDNKVKDFILNSKGIKTSSLSLDITYIDIGISKNMTNNTYDSFAKRQPAALPMGRAAVPSYLHLLLFAKADLTYDTPNLITSLLTDIKYLQTNLDEKPIKDKTKLTLKMRLPMERTDYFADSSIIISPIFNNTFEMKLQPLWSKAAKQSSRLDTMLGFNLDFLNLGFNIEAGGVMGSDFKRHTFTDAIDLGPGVNFFSKWSLFGPLELSSEINSYYLFALPGCTIPDKLGVGVEGSVWLRMAQFYDFSLSLVNDFLLASLQNDRATFASSYIFGVTLSYGHLFRIFN